MILLKLEFWDYLVFGFSCLVFGARHFLFGVLFSTPSCFLNRAPCCCTPEPSGRRTGGRCLFWGGYRICLRSGRTAWRAGYSGAAAPCGCWWSFAWARPAF